MHSKSGSTMGTGVLMVVIKACNNVIKPDRAKSRIKGSAQQCNQKSVSGVKNDKANVSRQK